MSWPCYLVELIQEPYTSDDGTEYVACFKLADGTKRSHHELKIGAVWRCRYENDLIIKLPGWNGENYWHMERVSGMGAKWTISGDAPILTATPSVNCVGSYHGWVQNGVVTDDCDGRKFEDCGKEIK